ncbi:MAG: hypothetical protein R3266_14555 [Gemmatimonadota bacterium]|nr:hypothetical protein [Gemmatimonadota bacterium]
MKWHALATVVAVGVAAGCSGNSPIHTGPSPRPDVVATGSGTVVTTGSRSTAATLGIPPGHLPAPGNCRLWEPGRPPGQQKHLPSGSCTRVEPLVRPGQWVVYRPGANRKVVEVRTYAAAGSSGGLVLRWTRVFDVATGVLLSESSHE